MSTTPPQRHGCLTALLVFMLAANSLTMTYYLFAGEKIAVAFPNAPTWLPTAMAVVSGLNIFLTISVFRWKKWAFYAFCVVAVGVFAINVSIGIPLPTALLGLVGPALLYGVLQIGEENKGWPQLK